MTRSAPFACRPGFTLIESMGAVVIIAVLSGFASMIILNAVDGYTNAAVSAQLHAELSIALDRAQRELRKIELKSGSGNAPNITSVADTDIQWTDKDSDTYRLRQNGTTLELTIDNAGPSILLADVTSFSVQTSDEDDDSLANPVSAGNLLLIRRVALSVTLQRSGVSETLQTNVFIRSTMRGGDA